MLRIFWVLSGAEMGMNGEELLIVKAFLRGEFTYYTNLYIKLRRAYSEEQGDFRRLFQCPARSGRAVSPCALGLRSE